MVAHAVALALGVGVALVLSLKDSGSAPEERGAERGDGFSEGLGLSPAGSMSQLTPRGGAL